MLLTDIVLAEHGLFCRFFSEIDALINETEKAEDVQRYGQILAAMLITHAKLEDAILIPTLANLNLGPRAPLLHAEHEDIADGFRGLPDIGNYVECSAKLRGLMTAARAHFKKEEWLISKIAQGGIDQRILADGGARWVAEGGMAVQASEKRTSDVPTV